MTKLWFLLSWHENDFQITEEIFTIAKRLIKNENLKPNDPKNKFQEKKIKSISSESKIHNLVNKI